jgi:hypothetical protein
MYIVQHSSSINFPLSRVPTLCIYCSASLVAFLSFFLTKTIFEVVFAGLGQFPGVLPPVLPPLLGGGGSGEKDGDTF